jgi:murein DD-endopeptidase MepM/ murein hydrolase activator NlpD
LQKRTDGAWRLVAHLRPVRHRATSASRVKRRSVAAARVNRRSIAAARRLRAWLPGARPTPRWLRTNGLAGLLHPFTTAERILPIAVASIVAVAAMLSLLPAASQGAVGGTTGSATDVRIAVGGEFEAAEPDPAGGAGPRGDVAAGPGSEVDGFRPVTLPEDVANAPESETTALDAGPLLDDGTLITGYAPMTTVEDGANLIRTYRVRAGDTLSTIARRFKVSMMTLWWANKLKSKDELHIGQTLRIPPVSGLVVTVTPNDTLDSLAAKYRVDAARIVDLNGLEDPTLVVGQVLVLPGATGAPIPTPKPTPRPTAKPSGGGSRVSGPARYTGGTFRWPVVGGNNYISQYFHYGHYAIDIAADYGARVVAAAGGRVTFAGWKSNGGGYQVWISHGSNLYTTYNHMSAITVGSGQYVGRGQQVGRVGQSGNATGPHLHFEVWIGPIWNGGTRVNPLRYL